MNAPKKQTAEVLPAEAGKPAEEADLGPPKYPELQFKVVSVERMDMPSGGTGGVWYRYVIANEATTVTGSRRGSKAAVTEHAKEFAEQLTSRIEPRRKARWPTHPKRQPPIVKS